jgi:prepilin-type N-terminal cleavage/methylation domain-containing protein
MKQKIQKIKKQISDGSEFKFKAGFSLLELSIVLLVIGMLVIGVTQGRDMVYKAKLASARLLTQNSVVGGTNGLALWLDSTSIKALLASETIDAAKISAWRDTNPVAVTRITAAQSTTNSKPTYAERSINGLPAIKFNGTSQFLDIASFATLANNKATIFFVFKSNSVNGQNFLYMQPFGGSACVNNIEIGIDTGSNVGAGNFGIHKGCNSANIAAAGTIIAAQPTIITLEILNSGNTPSNTNIYKNSVSLSVSADTGGWTTPSNYANTAALLRIGARYDNGNNNATDAYFNGYIGEIIVISEILKPANRKAIEKYLGQKWGIGISSY